MSYGLQLRLKDGTYQDVALAEGDAGTLAQMFQDQERQAAFDDLELTLDNTDGTWTGLFTTANLPPTDAYPSIYGFRVLLDGTPFWEGDLEYTAVEHDEESSTTRAKVTDAMARLTRHNAENLKRDYSGIAIVSGVRHSKQLTVNSVLDANGEPLVQDDEVELACVKPNTKIGKQTLKVLSVDPVTNVITFKKRLRWTYADTDVINVKDPWFRGHTAEWLLGRLCDLEPGFDSLHRVISYDAVTWPDIVDVADFKGLDAGAAAQKVADQVNANVFTKLGILYAVGRELQADPSPVKALDGLVGDGAPQPVGAERYDVIVVKGREDRQVRKGVMPFGGHDLTIDLPFTKDRTILTAIADRYWDYWGRVRQQIPGLPVAADGTPYTVGKRVSLGGVNYKVTRASMDLEDESVWALDLLAESGILPDPGAYDQDDLVDDDEDPWEPADLVFTKAYTPSWTALFPADKYPRVTTVSECDSSGQLISITRMRLLELHWAYPYDEQGAPIWRFQVTVWPDGKDREKPERVVTVPPDQQPDGLYYAKVRLPAGQIWWADVTVILDDLRESPPSDENSSSAEDDYVGTSHYYSAAVAASLVLRADTRPLPPDGTAAHYYSADIAASLWLDARPDGTRQPHRYSANITASLSLTAAARPKTDDKTHFYCAEIDASLWMDARPDGTRQLHRYAADIWASLWLAAGARPLVNDRTHYYTANVDASLWMDARPDGTRQLHRYAADIWASLWLSGVTDVGDPGGTGLTMALTSYEDDAPGTAAKECDLTATLAGSVILADRVIFHATRNGTPLPPARADIDAGATSAVAHWPRCAKAGDTLVVTAVKLRIHHKKTAVSGVSGGPPWTIAAGVSTYGGTGVPAALPAPSVSAVSGTGGPHDFEVDVSWAGLTAAEKARLYKVRVWVYHSGWVEKEPVDVRQLVLAGVTSCRVKVHVAKKLTSGASNYPNVKACLRDYYQQNGANGYLYGSGDGTTVSNSPQLPALEFYSTDNGYLRALQLELTDAVSSPTLAEVFNNFLLATASRLYLDGTTIVPRPVVVRSGTSFKVPAGVELFSGLPLPVWKADGTAPTYFQWLVYFPRFMGLLAWSSSTTYAAGDHCYSGTTVYRSKLDSNLNNAVSNTTYWANCGSVPAANKWAKFLADGALSDESITDPVDPSGTTEPPAGGGGCFGQGVFVLTADWTGVTFSDLWKAQTGLADREYGVPIMGFDLNAKNWAVTGALEVLRHPGKYQMVDVFGLASTPDHLAGIADPRHDGMGRVRWKAVGRLSGDYVVAIEGKRCGLRRAPEPMPRPTGMASAVFNLRTGTGNYWVGPTNAGPWYLVHNLKAGL